MGMINLTFCYCCIEQSHWFPGVAAIIFESAFPLSAWMYLPASSRRYSGVADFSSIFWLPHCPWFEELLRAPGESCAFWANEA